MRGVSDGIGDLESLRVTMLELEPLLLREGEREDDGESDREVVPEDEGLSVRPLDGVFTTVG